MPGIWVRVLRKLTLCLHDCAEAGGLVGFARVSLSLNTSVLKNQIFYKDKLTSKRGPRPDLPLTSIQNARFYYLDLDN